jgi:predicted DNA-binding antitoxin AbrB/MazE fold protein
MTKTVEAVYENGMLKLRHPLPLEEEAQVIVTVQTAEATEIGETRAAWLKQSEAALSATWSNPADDVFNELLDR